jgi:NADPH:quinone reductase-like Zn-dependent oxidoreductase
MRAALLREHGATPELSEVDEPVASGDGQAVVEVLAAGLNPVDLSTASGRFHGGAPEVPYVVGREGIARLEDGRRVYFGQAIPPHGSLAERTLIDEGSAIPLPDGVDEALALCFGIAGLAGWLALEWRARLREGETVIVLGASGPVGQVAVQASRLLGAGRVIAAARDPEGLRRAQELGADATVELGGAIDRMEGAMRQAAEFEINVVVDPLWGEPALAAMRAAGTNARLVQLGQSANGEATLDSATIRGKGLSILGHLNALAPADVRRAAYERMVAHAARGELRCEVERLPLDRIAEAWERQASSPGRKLVLIP